MSIGNSAASGAPLADGNLGADTGKTKGPPAKRQLKALADDKLVPETR